MGGEAGGELVEESEEVVSLEEEEDDDKADGDDSETSSELELDSGAGWGGGRTGAETSRLAGPTGGTASSVIFRLFVVFSSLSDANCLFVSPAPSSLCVGLAFARELEASSPTLHDNRSVSPLCSSCCGSPDKRDDVSLL